MTKGWQACVPLRPSGLPTGRSAIGLAVMETVPEGVAQHSDQHNSHPSLRTLTISFQLELFVLLYLYSGPEKTAYVKYTKK